MSTIVDETRARIALRLRLEREQRDWSLAELAARSGVSKAMISKVEREEASPTAVTLVRLAGAFDLTLAGLLLRAEGHPGGHPVWRSVDRPVWRDPETGYLRRQVFAQTDHPVEIVDVELPAGREVVLPASSYARIRQALWVRTGELVIVEGGERHVLGPGDCLGFGPPSDVTLANATDAPCSYVVVLARS